MTIRRLFPMFLLAAGLYAQTPAITSIQNPASNILPGLPNFGIAQGSIFVLYGTNIGPTTLAQAPALPLGTTLANTSVKITPPGGAAVLAPIVYVLNTQIAAVMPSSIPLTVNNVFATMQVTYNGVAGNVFSVRVVDSNFGISTADQTGTGRAVITDASFNVITQANSAKNGSTYTMWGTGLGAANSDVNTATNGDLLTPLQVFVGGVEANVTYRGRSFGPGLDQINFTIPAGVSGCYVSLTVQTNTAITRVSNAPTIPIAANGGNCSDVNSFPPAIVNAALAKGNLTVGGFLLDNQKKQAKGFFLRFSPAQWAGAGNLFGIISPGSCITTVQTGSGGGNGGVPSSTGLDAGTSLTLTPPSGSAISMPLVQAGVYFGNLTSLPSGTYTATNNSGGKDISAFSISLNGPPPFAWTNANISTVTRSQGLKITWAGGDANSFVDINGSAGGNPVIVNGQPVPTNVNATFECQVPSLAGSFTVPPSILLAIPGVAAGTGSNGSVQINLQTYPQQLTIPGTDYGFAIMNTATITANVAFQ